MARHRRATLPLRFPVQLVLRPDQEFRGYAGQVEESIRRARAAQAELLSVPLGGTAVGTGINAHPEYAAEWQYLSERQGLSSRLGRPGTADGAGGGPAPPWRLSGTGSPPAPSAT